MSGTLTTINLTDASDGSPYQRHTLTFTGDPITSSRVWCDKNGKITSYADPPIGSGVPKDGDTKGIAEILSSHRLMEDGATDPKALLELKVPVTAGSCWPCSSLADLSRHKDARMGAKLGYLLSLNPCGLSQIKLCAAEKDVQHWAASRMDVTERARFFFGYSVPDWSNFTKLSNWFLDQDERRRLEKEEHGGSYAVYNPLDHLCSYPACDDRWRTFLEAGEHECDSKWNRALCMMDYFHVKHDVAGKSVTLAHPSTSTPLDTARSSEDVGEFSGIDPSVTRHTPVDDEVEVPPSKEEDTRSPHTSRWKPTRKALKHYLANLRGDHRR